MSLNKKFAVKACLNCHPKKGMLYIMEMVREFAENPAEPI
jgi:hypothetical protein